MPLLASFPSGRKGKLSIGFKSNNENQLYLKISDNGIGLPPDFDLEETESLGLKLVWNLTEQLGGDIKVDSSSGTSFQFTFARKTHST